MHFLVAARFFGTPYTLLFRAEVPADQIQLMGDWRSDAYKKCLSYDLSYKIKISKVMSKFINSS